MAMHDMVFIALVFTIIGMNICGWAAKSEPLVETKLGSIQGSVLLSDENRDFFAFRGIPYAQPPVKHLRFQPPKPVLPWTGPLDATEDGPACIQLDMITKELMGDEDCLYLNVYTPQVKSPGNHWKFSRDKVSLPVMVFIHGGSYIMGSGRSSMFGPHRLVDRNVIIVTINYRLGVFGFLSTEDDASPGNYGLMDQIEAFRWIQHHIRAFGGDPNQVTIFGESAGSLSVLLHLVSPLAKGLFHGIIAQSGSPYCDGILGLVENPLRWAKMMGELMKCPTNETHTLVYCLKKRPALEVLLQSLKIDAAKDLAMGLKFAPSYEKSTSPGFLPKGVSSLIDVQILHKVPVILGVNKDEGLFIYGSSAVNQNATGRDNLNRILPKVLQYFLVGFSTEQQANVYDTIIQEYGLKDESLPEAYVVKILIQIYGDLIFSSCTDKTIQHLADTGIPIYPYKLMYATSKDYGTVNHGADLQYLFRFGHTPDNTFLEGDDRIVSDIMTSLWTSFAKTRKPSLDGAKFIYPDIDWTSVSSNPVTYFEINKIPSIVTGLLCAKAEFWNRILPFPVQQNSKQEL